MDRFKVIVHSTAGYGEYEVWDTEESNTAKRKDGQEAIYKDYVGAREHAYKRCENLNKFGYSQDQYQGRWQAGKRGRPPKVVNGKGGNGRGYGQQTIRATSVTTTETHGTAVPNGYAEAAKIEAVAAAREVAAEIARESVGREAKVDLSQEVIEAAVESVKADAARKLDGAVADARMNANVAAESLLEAMEAGQRAANDLMRLVENTDATELLRGQLSVATDMAVEEMTTILEAMKEEIKQHKALTVISDRGTKVIKERTHKRFEALVRAVAAGTIPMLVGPAGSGKTFAAEQLSIAFGLEDRFYAMAVGSQSSKSDFLGFITATGEYRGTQFREAYEHGGVFLCDEIDAGNANVLIVINAALSGKFCAFPDKMVKKHDDFLFVGTANTYGTGASRQYVGRNQLDAATLDRFVAFDWPIDEDLEAATVEHFEQGARWHTVVKAVRARVDREGMRVVVSPRATIKGAHLLAQNFTVEEVIEMTLLATANGDQRSLLLTTALGAW